MITKYNTYIKENVDSGYDGVLFKFIKNRFEDTDYDIILEEYYNSISIINSNETKFYVSIDNRLFNINIDEFNVSTLIRLLKREYKDITKAIYNTNREVYIKAILFIMPMLYEYKKISKHLKKANKFDLI